MTCEGCEKRKAYLQYIMGIIAQSLQRAIRRVSGSERYLIRHGVALHQVIEAGSALEHKFSDHEKVTAKWLENLHQRANWLEQQNSQLRGAVAKLSDRVKLIEESTYGGIE